MPNRSLPTENFCTSAFNLAQRSASINSEIALVIHSEILANQVAESFFRDVLPNSWRLLHCGRVNWIEEREVNELFTMLLPISPGRQVEAAPMSILPIESQLWKRIHIFSQFGGSKRARGAALGVSL